MRKAHDASEMPEWYWADGLHDARICSAALCEIPPDWKTKTSWQSVVEITIDSRQALFARDIQKIALLDTQIISGRPESLTQCCWQSDVLERLENGRYRLEIEAKSVDDEMIDLRVEFSHAETERVIESE